MAELLQLTLDASIAPARVVAGQPYDQLADLPHDAGAADALLLVVVVDRDQSAVPSQDRVRPHDGRDPAKQATAQRLPLGGEPASLVVGQP